MVKLLEFHCSLSIIFHTISSNGNTDHQAHLSYGQLFVNWLSWLFSLPDFKFLAPLLKAQNLILLSHAYGHAQSCQLFTIPWTIAHQVPLSMEFSRWEYCEVGCHVLLQGIFLTQGSNLHLSCVSCIGRQILYNWATWEAPHRYATHHLTSCLCKKLYLNTVAKMKGFPILTWNEVLKASALLPGVHVISFSNRVRACPACEWMKRQTRGKLLIQLSGIYLDTSHKISSYPSAYILNCVPSYSLLSNYLLRMYKDNTSFQGTGSSTVNRTGVILEGGRY